MTPDDVLSSVVQVAVAVAGSSLIATFLTARATRRKITAEAGKSGADASAVLADSALGLLEPWIKQVDRLDARLVAAQVTNDRAEGDAAAARHELAGCRAELLDLREQLAAARATIREQSARLAAFES